MAISSPVRISLRSALANARSPRVRWGVLSKWQLPHRLSRARTLSLVLLELPLPTPLSAYTPL